MAAITDLIDRVSDSSTGRPIIASLAAPGKALAASSINLAAATNWTTTTAIHFSIYETTTVGSTVVKNASTQTDWKGVLSGTTVSNLTLTGGTDRTYTAGAVVELTPTARYAKDIYDWATNRHNQDGTHKAFTETAIVPTVAIQDAAVISIKLADSAATVTKIAPGAITLGYAEITSSFTSTTVGSDVDVTGLSVTFTAPTNARRIKATLTLGSFSNGNSTFVVKIKEGATQLQALDGATLYSGSTMYTVVPSAGSHTYKVSIIQSGAGTMFLRGSATAPSSLLIEAI